jgi:hypothetical protein
LKAALFLISLDKDASAHKSPLNDSKEGRREDVNQSSDN